MNKTLLILACLCMLGMSSQVLAQTGTTGTSSGSTASSTAVGFPVEQFVFGTMTTDQQNNYMQALLVSNLATQVLTAAAYSSAEKKVRDSDPLTAFDQFILARGPFPVLPGNQSFVPIGGTGATSSSSTGSTGSTSSTGTTGTTGTTGSTTGS